MGIPRRMGQRRPNRCWGPRGRARAEKKSKRSTGDREQYAGFVEHFPSTEYVCCPAVGCFIYCLSSWSHFKPVAESILGLHFYRGRTDSSHQALSGGNPDSFKGRGVMPGNAFGFHSIASKQVTDSNILSVQIE
ncbi:hypothetical protein M0657_010789 [Pyricularia oryzae]|nr:hypothetical protein M9X92_010943 [Pyricularia oryzae]KAI7911742.1 hypothetical protein M0657_010789 [Pyricularia oryzae]